MLSLKPQYWYDTIYDIDFDKLKEKGVKCILFDIDNTMATYSENDPSEKLLALCETLRTKDFTLAILSNGNSDRVKHFATVMGMKFYGKALKPMKKGFRSLCDELGFTKNDIAIVGDQLFTDILGGNNFGCISVLVTPIEPSSDPAFVKFKRIFEKGTIRKLKKTEK